MYSYFLGIIFWCPHNIGRNYPMIYEYEIDKKKCELKRFDDVMTDNGIET